MSQSSSLDSRQVHELIKLSHTEPIGKFVYDELQHSDKKEYKYGRVLYECRFDERSFAHLVARF